MTAVGLERRRAVGGIGVVWLALLMGGCDVIVLEPDLDLGVDQGPPAPVLGDGRVADMAFPEDSAPPDLALPLEALLMPAGLDFGEVEPYSTTQSSVSLVAGRRPLEIASVGVGGPGFTLDARSPRAPMLLMPGDAVRWTVDFTPEIAGQRSAGEMVVVTDDGIRRVPLAGRGAWAGPPCEVWSVEVDPAAPQLISPGTALALKAIPPATVAADDVGLRWTLVDAPLPPERVPLESFDDARSPGEGGPPDDDRTFTAVLFADKPGRYLFEATPVLPLSAACPPAPTTVAVHACPCPERPLHVRVAWQRSLDAPEGQAWVAPFLISGSAGDWTDGLSADASAIEWGREGPLDDGLLDISASDGSGRIDAWIADGRVANWLRLGFGIFNGPDSPRTAVDITVEIDAGAEVLATFERRGIEAGRIFWDVAALVPDGNQMRVVPYDRVLDGQIGALPEPGTVLGVGSACDPWYGPACSPRSQCRPGPDGGRCRH